MPLDQLVTEIPESVPTVEQSIQNFINEVGVDHPQFAEELRTERLPDFLKNIRVVWQEFQGDLLSKPNWADDENIRKIVQQEDPDEEFVQAFMKGIAELKYVSNKEIVSIMKEYAAEVEQELSANPNSVVIFETDYYEDSSETYFAKMVYGMLSPENQMRVKFSVPLQFEDRQSAANQEKIIYYRFDDSSNSGSQVISSIISTIREFKPFHKPIEFRVRLMAGNGDIKRHVQRRVAEWLVKDNDDDIEYKIDLKLTQPNKRIEIAYKGQIVTWGTSIVFGHKIQDNLPNFFISLDKTHRREKPHLFRLDEDILPPYKKKE